jgi:hypothetical protein
MLQCTPPGTTIENKIKKIGISEAAPVAQAGHPSYSGGRDHEDHGSKPAQANGSRDLTQKELVDWLKV